MTQPEPNGIDLPPQDPRVRFAAERTLLAWMRTGLALMGFGFVVARFGLFLQEIAAVGHITMPHRSTGWSLGIGVGLISLGVIVSMAAGLEYGRFVRPSKQGPTHPPRTVFLAIVVAFLLSILGIVMAIYLLLLGA